MKTVMKTLIVLCCALSCSLPAISQSSHPYPETVAKVSVARILSNTSYPYRFFDGFNFTGYIPSRVGLLDLVMKEYATVTANDAAEGRNGKYALIGHSQGGPRVLAYASYAAKVNPYEYNRIQAVITLSGIDRGLKMLEGGIGRARSVIETDADILYHGFSAAALLANGSIFLGPPLTYLYKSMNEDIEKNAIRNVLFESLIPKNISAWLKPAYLNYQGDQMGEIRDMIPGSDFLTQNVSSSSQHIYKVLDHIEVSVRWENGAFWEPPHPVNVTTPIYAYYTMYEDVPQFPRDLPVGFIVGRNSNTLSMAGESETLIRNSCNAARELMSTSASLHIARCVNFNGLISGGFAYVQDCLNASMWFGFIDGQLDELKGSPENDGFVAKENQFIQKTYVGKENDSIPVLYNVVGSNPAGYTEFLDLNHASIQAIDNPPVHAEIELMLYQAKQVRP